MKMPWMGKSGMEKAAAMFATLTLVSFGLCGANFVLAMGAASVQTDKILLVLTVTAYVELAGIVIGLVGLFVVGCAAVVQAVMNSRRKSE